MMETRCDRPIRARRPALAGALAALLGLTLGLSACDAPTAFGEADSLIVIADSALWSEMEQTTYDALEPTFTTVRDERTFHVTHVAADGQELDQLLMWRQVLVFGTPDDPRIREIVDHADATAEPSPGDIVQAEDVWARGQLATAIILDPDARAESWRAALPEVAALLDRQFRQYAISRMWVSGVDTTFAENVEERYGITLRAPQIYHGGIDDEGRIRLRNDRPSPADRIRSILIERRERRAAADADTLGRLTADSVYAWRAELARTAYNVPQATERAEVEPRRFELEDARAIQVRGIWRDEGTYPAAGPFIARAVRCPEATWFFDAWLYAPHPEASKYEFMLQMEEILDSFRCATE